MYCPTAEHVKRVPWDRDEVISDGPGCFYSRLVFHSRIVPVFLSPSESHTITAFGLDVSILVELKALLKRGMIEFSVKRVNLKSSHRLMNRVHKGIEGSEDCSVILQSASYSID